MMVELFWKHGAIRVLECATIHHPGCERYAIDPNHRGPCTKPCNTPQPCGRPCRFHDGHFFECEPVPDGDTDYIIPEERPHVKRTRRDGASASTP